MIIIVIIITIVTTTTATIIIIIITTRHHLSACYQEFIFNVSFSTTISIGCTITELNIILTMGVRPLKPLVVVIIIIIIIFNVYFSPEGKNHFS